MPIRPPQLLLQFPLDFSNEQVVQRTSLLIWKMSSEADFEIEQNLLASVLRSLLIALHLWQQVIAGPVVCQLLIVFVVHQLSVALDFWT